MPAARLPARYPLLIGSLLAVALACSMPQTGSDTKSTPSLETAVAATLTSIADSASDTPAPMLPSETPTPNLGTVTGKVCYPSEPPLPPMNVYFRETSTGEETLYEHTSGAGDYAIELDPGQYVAFAWRVDSELAGSYSQAVTCGLTTDCSDHSLITFAVSAGTTTEDVDLCDWYGGPGAVPTPIGGLPWAGSLVTATTPTPDAPPGGVSLNCDGTYQRVRINDQGASGKTLSVDNWTGDGWSNVWNISSGDPMLKQLTEDAGWYQFGDCEKLVIVPFLHSGPQLWFELGIYAWNGSGMTSAYANEGYYGEWEKVGDLIRFKEASSLGWVNGGPLGPCEWLTLEHTWNGTAFVQTGSLIELVPNCTPAATATP